MNPAFRHFFTLPSFAGLPTARRLVAIALIAVGIALATPVDAQQAPDATYGPVRRADTLWELALRFRGDARVNAQQAMIAILRANPDAFVEGNINALRTGVTLRVPTAAEMEAISPGDAAAEFGRHEEAWRNRRQTGSAAPGPQAPSRPASPPADAAPAGGEVIAEELREARAAVAEMRERLAERDEAIEELLVQLAAARRELVAARAAAPAPPDGPDEGDDRPDGSDAATRASWLPVSPLILGSSLIVLLVLIVVVTLLRQRGDADAAYPEEHFEEGEEGAQEVEDAPDPYGDEDVREPYGRPDRAEDRPRGREAPPGMERRVPGSSPATGAASVGAGGAVAAHELAPDDEVGESRSADLPIGMDLDEDEDWDRAPEESSRLRTESEEYPGSPPGYRRQIEVGELDDLDFDGGPEAGARPNVPAGSGDEDDPPPGAGPRRRR